MAEATAAHPSTSDPAGKLAAPGTAPAGMTWIPAASFLMGSEMFYPEERPVHRVEVEGFWIDRRPITVREFRRFVAETGHVTLAERAPDPALYPGADRALLVPGSLVFHKPARRVPLGDIRAWWAYVPGACWRRPEGPDSSISGRQRHPVVHIAYDDAVAYALWAGKSLPTEAEWELAARGGLDGAVFAWGDDPRPGGRLMANTWQGEFPWQNLKANGYEGTSPVGAFPANGYGLYDTAGNVWEWTCDPFEAATARAACCTPEDARRAGEGCRAPDTDPPHIARRVIKGGSHLCAPNYCLRYRPAARQGEAVDTSTSHIGFRCVQHPDRPYLQSAESG